MVKLSRTMLPPAPASGGELGLAVNAGMDVRGWRVSQRPCTSTGVKSSTDVSHFTALSAFLLGNSYVSRIWSLCSGCKPVKGDYPYNTFDARAGTPFLHQLPSRSGNIASLPILSGWHIQAA